MRITYNRGKWEKTRVERGLDFRRAIEVFDGAHLTREDERMDYGELRFITVGWLDSRLVVMAWTARGRARRVISMRKANAREIEKYASQVA